MTDKVEVSGEFAGAKGAVKAPARQVHVLVNVATFLAFCVVAMQVYAHVQNSNIMQANIATLNVQLMASQDKVHQSLRELRQAVQVQTCLDMIPRPKETGYRDHVAMCKSIADQF